MSGIVVASGARPEVMEGASASMLANSCAGCHGQNGASNGPAIPSIAGLSSQYFIETMTEFKSGKLPATVMDRIARGFSARQIRLMADYFSAQPFIRAKQKFDPKTIAVGATLHQKYCEKCHNNAGQMAEDDTGILGGQWTPYLAATMQDYLSGRREMTKKMRDKVERLMDARGDEGLKLLLNFYASQQ